MKRFQMLPLLALLWAGCDLVPTDEETGPPILTLNPTRESVSIGDTVSLVLSVSDLTPAVFGLSLRIGYDTTRLSFDDEGGFMLGSFFQTEAVSFVKAESDRIHLAFTQTRGQSAVSGSGWIGTLILSGRAAGNGVVEVLTEDLHFYDSSGNAVDVADLLLESTSVTVE